MVLIYFLYERRCYCVVYLGYGIDLPWIRGSITCARTLALRAWAAEGGGLSPGARTFICRRVGCPQELTVIKKLASAAKVTQQQAKTGSRSRQSGRSTSLPNGTSLDQNSTSPRRTRSTKLTCSLCLMTAWGGRPFATFSQSLTSPAATRRLSL